MERVAQETMDKAMVYQNELENQKAAGLKQVREPDKWEDPNEVT